MKFEKSKRIFDFASIALIAEFFVFLFVFALQFSFLNKIYLRYSAYLLLSLIASFSLTLCFRWILSLFFSRCHNCNSYLGLTFGGECAACSYYNLPNDENGFLFDESVKGLNTARMENEQYVLLPDGELIKKNTTSVSRLNNFIHFSSQLAFNIIYFSLFYRNLNIVEVIQCMNVELSHSNHKLSAVIAITVGIGANFAFLKLKDKKLLYLIEFGLIFLIGTYIYWGLGITCTTWLE